MRLLRPSATLPTVVLWLAATLFLAGSVLRLAPHTPVPVHIGFNGVVDRYGDKMEVGCILLALAVIGLLIWIALEVMRQRTQRHHAFVAAQIVLLTAFCSIDFLIGAQIFGPSVGMNADIPRFHMAAMAMLFAAIGAFLGKVPQNPWVGVRTCWSRSSRLSWEKSNRLGGRLMFWIGAAGLLFAPAVPQPQGFRMLIAGVLLSAVACVFESWRVWRSDPERTKF
jgi:uncharacterized membrane protein